MIWATINPPESKEPLYTHKFIRNLRTHGSTTNISINDSDRVEKKPKGKERKNHSKVERMC